MQVASALRVDRERAHFKTLYDIECEKESQGQFSSYRKLAELAGLDLPDPQATLSHTDFMRYFKGETHPSDDKLVALYQCTGSCKQELFPSRTMQDRLVLSTVVQFAYSARELLKAQAVDWSKEVDCYVSIQTIARHIAANPGEDAWYDENAGKWADYLQRTGCNPSDARAILREQLHRILAADWLYLHHLGHSNTGAIFDALARQLYAMTQENIGLLLQDAFRYLAVSNDKLIENYDRLHTIVRVSEIVASNSLLTQEEHLAHGAELSAIGLAWSDFCNGESSAYLRHLVGKSHIGALLADYERRLWAIIALGPSCFCPICLRPIRLRIVAVGAGTGIP
jgi:hypothetical protein